VDYGFNPGSLRVSPQDARTLYAGLEGNGVFRSQDAGLTWTQLDNGLKGGAAKVICYLAITSDGKTLYCGTAGGLYRSQDRGDHWIRCGEQAGLTGAIAAVAIHPTRQNVMFAASESRVFGSRDGGNTWQGMSNGLRVGVEKGRREF
jgi:photosystem II stability/assembly factor-like uncharacterized protein